MTKQKIIMLIDAFGEASESQGYNECDNEDGADHDPWEDNERVTQKRDALIKVLGDGVEVGRGSSIPAARGEGENMNDKFTEDEVKAQFAMSWVYFGFGVISLITSIFCTGPFALGVIGLVLFQFASCYLTTWYAKKNS